MSVVDLAVQWAFQMVALRADPWVAAMAAPWGFESVGAMADLWAACLADPSVVALVVDLAV